MIADKRAPTTPEQVKLYLRPPAKYEEIALVASDSNASFAVGTQSKVNAAIKRAKKEASKLGANGLLLQGLGDQGGMMVGNTFGTATSGSYYGTGVGVVGGGLVKTVSAVAIWVEAE